MNKKPLLAGTKILLPLLMLIGLAGASGACKKQETPVTGRGNVILLGEGSIGSFDYVEGATMELKASNYPGADASHIIVRKPGMGARLAFDNVDGTVNVTISKDGADVILCRAGSRYSGVENGRLAYGRRPTWNCRSNGIYTPTAEETSFVEVVSDEFSSYLSSESGLNLGSLTKVASGNSIEQIWYYTPGGSFAKRGSNAIGYNAAEMRPNTAFGGAIIKIELLEMLIGLDDIFGRDTYKDLCDSSGNLTREYKDLLFYVFAKEN